MDGYADVARIPTVRRAAAASVMCALLASCSGASAPEATTVARSAPESRSFTGVDGVETAIGDLSRIVSLNGDLTEIVYELGFGGNVVGVDVTTTHPPEAAGLLEAGGGVGFAQALVPEAVLRLDPTLVIGDELVAPGESVEQLRAAGVPVVILETQTELDGIADKIGQVAEVLGVPDAGVELAGRVQAEIDAARNLVAGDDTDPRVAFVYVRGPQVVLLFGADTPTHAMFEGAGAVDAAADAGIAGPAQLTPEALVAAAPEVIVLPQGGLDALGGVDALLEIPGIAETPAGRDGAFLAYDEAYFFNLGPRAGLALDEFIRDLYPGIGG
jgi:iron complex transport system substrate-binding protein